MCQLCRFLGRGCCVSVSGMRVVCVAGPVIACWCLGQRTTPGVCATIVARRSTQDIVAPFADYTRWINGLTLVQLATILLDIGGVTYRRMR
jgi:hypothetical protein